MAASVLIIATAANTLHLKDGSSAPTGVWAEELVIPYHVFREHGLEVHIATPKGAAISTDPASFDPDFLDGDVGRALNLKEQWRDIEEGEPPLSLERLALSTTDYQGLFFPGGYGPLTDLAASGAAGNMVKKTLSRGGIIGAVCHGPAALLPATHEGRWLFHGYRMTCFSPDEEVHAGYRERLDRILAEQLDALGGNMEFAPPGQEHVVIDKQLYTGQNPRSSERLAWEMARKLKKMDSLDKAACGTPCN